jgi:hypothetical protein
MEALRGFALALRDTVIPVESRIDAPLSPSLAASRASALAFLDAAGFSAAYASHPEAARWALAFALALFIFLVGALAVVVVRAAVGCTARATGARRLVELRDALDSAGSTEIDGNYFWRSRRARELEAARAAAEKPKAE